MRIAVDVGKTRVGMAKTDSSGILAVPIGTFLREKDDFRALREAVSTSRILEIYVGLPLNMDGTEGKSARDARRWARRAGKWVCGAPIRFVDERLTTVTAHRQLHEAGRREISHRAVVDQQAAVIILESALAYERNTGKIPGIPGDGGSVDRDFS